MSAWRPIEGFTSYEVSDEGQVRSHRRATPRVLRPATDPKGYRLVTLFRGDRATRRNYRVHSLVMAAFVGPRPEGQQVRHLNGDPADNRLSNLAYGTPQQNVRDCFDHGTRGQATACKNGHDYTPENTRTHPKGWRECRSCRREWRERRQIAGAL